MEQSVLNVDVKFVVDLMNLILTTVGLLVFKSVTKDRILSTCAVAPGNVGKVILRHRSAQAVR